MQPTSFVDADRMRPVRECKAPATCGELIQGTLGDRDFLVNCPIDLYSKALLYSSDAPGVHIRDPHSFAKVHEVIELVSKRAGLRLASRLVIDSSIPRGKGMASSTADVTAAAAVVSGYYGIVCSAVQLARLITEVEPSDCVHFPGIAHVNHLSGELIGTYPVPAGMRVLAVDCGGIVDTLSFERERARSIYRRNQALVKGMVDMLIEGLRSGDLSAVGKAASASARLSQQILPKRPFAELCALGDAHGALGVNCAHSGTVLGILHVESEEFVGAMRADIERHFGSDVDVLGDFAVVGGGCHAC